MRQEFFPLSHRVFNPFRHRHFSHLFRCGWLFCLIAIGHKVLIISRDLLTIVIPSARSNHQPHTVHRRTNAGLHTIRPLSCVYHSTCFSAANRYRRFVIYLSKERNWLCTLFMRSTYSLREDEAQRTACACIFSIPLDTPRRYQLFGRCVWLLKLELTYDEKVYMLLYPNALRLELKRTRGCVSWLILPRTVHLEPTVARQPKLSSKEPSHEFRYNQATAK